ncbi:DUF3954 domain-containing protein [Sporosarcina sp. FSL K6-1508]|uniref:DUF3954 domain-containing protein n=1 Tax=Sporosarcina sp. FSL K6-1508 TaxID=2921553 RepID=UPI0030F7ED56
MTRKIEISLSENAVYKVENGNLEKISLNTDAVLVIKKKDLKLITKPESGFGEQLITWQDGKIHTEKVSFTMR